MIADPLLVQTDPFVQSAARDFQEHIFGIGWETGCCNAVNARYCADGLALKADYEHEHCERSEPESPPVYTRRRPSVDTHRRAG